MRKSISFQALFICLYVCLNVCAIFPLLLLNPSISLSIWNSIPCHHGTSQRTACTPAWSSQLFCEFQRKCPSKWGHLIHFTLCEISTNSNVPHYKVKGISTTFISCGSPFVNRTLMSLPTLQVGKPQQIMNFRLKKECVASLSTHKTFLPFIWASRYRILGLG